MSNKSGSSPTSRRNRNTARSIKDEKGKQKYRGTNDARADGVPLPDAEEINKQEVDSTRPRVPAYKPTKKNNT